MPKPRAKKGRRDASRADTPDHLSAFRLRVGDVIARLLPSGSRGSRADAARTWREDWRDWEPCPDWPPDLFAVVATLVQKSGAYAYRSHDLGRRGTFDQSYLRLVTDAGAAWRESPASPPAAAQDAWLQLFEWMDEPLEPASADWWIACLKLMAIADEAAWGMGYVIDEPRRRSSPAGPAGSELPGESSFAATVVQAYQAFAAQGRATAPLVHIPNSLCWRVPTGECCVLPKARTPQVGITLAAFSHHLALLPSATEVRPRWLVNPVERELPQNGRETFNWLLVPYPYRIHGTAFAPVSGVAARGRGRRFDIHQEWLSLCKPGDFASFVTRLSECARREVGEVHGVALPELALDADYFKALGGALAAQGVRVLVAGVHAQEGDAVTNQVRTALYHGHREALTEVSQAKHHRWKLDGGQIRRYHLGHALDPAHEWWEQTDLQRRECTFLQAKGAVIATLVCEDLARVEPVQTILRSVGPNLVIAVLMDGPQREWRWSGRSATVLADDPGSAVLTLTSLGMVRRSVMPGEPEPREIALWKEPAGETRELKLPAGCHGLLLSLTLGWELGYSFDGRDDRGSSLRLAQGGVHGIAHPQPPRWLEV